MTAVDQHQRPSHAPDGVKLLAQAIVLTVFVLAALAVGWLYVSDLDWYAPAMGLIVLARFGYDRFFSEG